MQTNRELTQRFLDAYAQLLDAGLTNKTRFCLDIGADRRNFEKMLSNPSRHLLRPEWIGNAVLAYGVSAHWLLTGQGALFGL
jgi:hypothetical protein